MSQFSEKTFGPYQLVKRLAMGGMAELYQAHRVGMAGFVRDVVLKRIHPEYSEDDEFVRMFINEAKIAAMLRHPNIVPVIDFDFVDGMYYLVMELVEGLDLRQLCLRSLRENRSLPVPLAIWIVAQALQGLAYAHHFSHRGQVLNVIHRDISPQNILVSVRGNVMLTDFGIARVLQHVSMTAHGVLKGKASYMAPEQTQSSHVDARADLFSMGVVFWELLCGERLFQASNDVLVMDMVRSFPIPPPHTRNPAVDESLSALVMWALEREPTRRIPDAQTWLRALQPWLLSSSRDQLAAYVCLLCHKTFPLTGVAGTTPPEPQKQPDIPAQQQTLEMEPWLLQHHPTPPIPTLYGENRAEPPDDTPRSWGSFPTLGAAADEMPKDAQPSSYSPLSMPAVDTQDILLQTVRIEPHLLLSAAKEEVRLFQTTGDPSSDGWIEAPKSPTPAASWLHTLDASSQHPEPADVLTTVFINPKEYLQQMQAQVSMITQPDQSKEDESAQQPQRTETMEPPKEPNRS